MKILLLRPYYGITINSDMHGDLGTTEYYPQTFPDLSLIYAATIANQIKNVDMEVIDANAERIMPEAVLTKMKQSYDIIIIKVAAPSIKYDLNFAKKIKSIYPQAKVILCGHVVKILKQWILSNIPEIDEVVEQPIDKCIYRILTGNDEYISLDQYPVPDYTLFPYKKFHDEPGTLRGTLQMSRGCSIGCQYCPYTSFFGRKIESRSVDKVIMDIKTLLSLGYEYIFFRDQYFTWNAELVDELCDKIISEKLKFTWTCETRIDSLNTDLIDKMKAAGLKMINFGVESASTEILENFNRKTYDIEEVKKIVDYLKKKEVSSLAFFIVGFPDDTWESIKATYDLSIYLNADFVRFALFSPNLSDGAEGVAGNKYLNHEITPDLFDPLGDTLTFSPCKNLTLEELKFLRDQVSIMYYANTRGLEFGYHREHDSQLKFRNMIAEVNRKNRIAML